MFFVPCHLDDTKKLTNIIVSNQRRSMLKMKHDILSALLIETTKFPGEAGVTSSSPWHPVDSNGSKLFDTLHPTVYVAPKRHKNWPMLYQYVELKFTFFWKL